MKAQYVSPSPFQRLHASTQVEVKTLRLAHREVFSLSAKRRGQRLTVRAGRVWITQPNDPVDHIIEAGESFTVTHPGKILVQSLCSSAELSLAA
ncbi:MAG TPA: DUF2917 domain-containing protein [Anaerolineaceae bacterium]|nr:DUF2917 domain-containing protein [Anaerolineaceae bacterium]